MTKVKNLGKYILKIKLKVVTEMVIWGILHTNGLDEIQVKIGRYKKPWKDLVNKTCKSELTLDSEEWNNFLVNLFSNKNIKFNFEQIKSDECKQKIIESWNKPENKGKWLSFFNKKENEYLIYEKIRSDQMSAIKEFEQSLIDGGEKESYW